MDAYVSEREVAPHCWQVAHRAFCNIVIQDRGHQSILISGESGAGKTETVKTLLQYLGQLSYSNSRHTLQEQLCSQVCDKLRDSNPILESFGNAKTVRNDNSSRFGKYIKVVLQAHSGVILGAQMETYLLEKSRIVTQGEGERGYHVFYEFLAGTTPEERLRYGGLKDAAHYKCLNQGNCFQRRSTDGQREDDAKMYRNLLAAMENLGIPEKTREQIFTVLAAILHLQNVEFGTNASSGKSTICTPAILETAARLLGVDATALGEMFTIKSTTKIMTIPSTQKEASDIRDAVSKALYQSVFDWLVAKLNEAIQGETFQVPEDKMRYIGLLDIFGFENFENNSLEQLCINYANEALTNLYNKCTFVEDAQECGLEGIPLATVEFPDNQPCVNLIEGTGGLISLLDDQTHFKLGTNERFTQKAWEVSNPFNIKPKSSCPNVIGIRHYAGDVMYSTPGFLEKNADTLKDEVRTILSASTASEFIRQLLPPDAPPLEDARRRQVKASVASKFRTQLKALQEELSRTESHFIRCVKPNPDCRPLSAHKPYVLAQLNSAGVVQTIQMKRGGCPARIPHTDFWRRFRLLARGKDRRAPDGDEKAKCERLLQQWPSALAANDFAIGRTKVFLKSPVVDFLEDRRGRRVQELLNMTKPLFLACIRRCREAKVRRMENEKLVANNTETAAEGFDQPHAAIPGAVENTGGRQMALEDMSTKRILDLLGLRPEVREKMLAKGIRTKHQVFQLSDHDMGALEFIETERERLKAIILSQQSNWVIQQRVNQIFPLQLLDALAPPADSPAAPAAPATTSFAAACISSSAGDLLQVDMQQQLDAANAKVEEAVRTQQELRQQLEELRRQLEQANARAEEALRGEPRARGPAGQPPLWHPIALSIGVILLAVLVNLLLLAPSGVNIRI
eukprot:GGOE01045833.1.p1 GENE.GGOE01045833.1~~GGOE01045833.1.p1  ORF type:complete len:1051 (+),score=349.15 GGOE01045833.1:422-3154(+)